MELSKQTPSQIFVGDVITVRKASDATLWDVVGIDGNILTIRERGTNYATQQFPASCVYKVVKVD